MALYWFAAMLTDADGAWRGRLVRSSSAAAPSTADREALLTWRADVPPGKGELLLPAGGEGEGWLPADARGDGLSNEVMAGPRIIALDTARHAEWSFARSSADLADLGWLLNRVPDASPGKAGKRSPVQLIRLLAEIERDADTRELEKSFRADPELSYQLLRLLNSAAFGMRTPVRGLAQAITLLGRRQLQRWLQLLIYAQSGGSSSSPNPLLQLAAYRGLLLENLARHARHSGDELDAAYMTGIFSLLDRIIAQPLTQIVRQLPLAPTVAAALAIGEGSLGEALALAVACERGELDTASALLDRRGLSPLDWLRLQDAAYGWAYGLGLPGEAAA